MNELALFAGAGGGLLGTRLLGWKTVCAVEFNPFRRELLLRRQQDGLLDVFPIWDDVRTFDGCPWRGIVDVVSAGFPCQPFSSAGRQLGPKDERNMWPETIRIIREVGPPLVWLENVPGLGHAKKAKQRLLKGFGKATTPAYLGTVLGELAEAGYDARWDCVSAADVGAYHIRERIWILAYLAQKRTQPVSTRRRPKGKGAADAQRTAADAADAQEDGRPQGRASIDPRQRQSFAPGGSGVAADAHQAGLEERKNERASHELAPAVGSDWWAAEPGVVRVVHGLPHRMDRIEALGDGQVPAVVREAWRRLTNPVD